MGWRALGAQISSKWWGCPSALSAAAAAETGTPQPTDGEVREAYGLFWSTHKRPLPRASPPPEQVEYVPGTRVSAALLLATKGLKTTLRPGRAHGNLWMLPPPDLLGHSGCCRKGTWCVPTCWRARIWLGVTRTRCRVVPNRSRVVVLPVGPPSKSVCRTATGSVSLHGWFVWMTCWWRDSRSCRWFHMRVPILVGRPR